MNNNLSNKHIKALREKYEEAVAAYLVTLGDLWDIDVSQGYWVADDIVTGGIWCYGETVFMNVDDIILCVERNISYSAFMDYLDYNVWAADFGFDNINLISWINGKPRVDEATQERLSAMRYELEKLIQDEKEKVKNGKEKPF